MRTRNNRPRRAKLPAAAEQYGVSVKTLRRRIASGHLTAYRLGSRIIVGDLDELDALFTPIPTVGGGSHDAA
jgi:excisionase family DNA binding protein